MAITLGGAGALTAQGGVDPRARAIVPVLEYHKIGVDSRWGRSPERFRRDLEILYQRGYRPVTVAQLIDGALDIPDGTKPIVFTFDDASPGQFRYIERNGGLEIDPRSAVGIWMDFSRAHPDWKPRATFCLLSGADAGHAFFGDKGIEGQKSAWRFRKLRYLAEQGFELCAHTLWHANLAKYDDATVQEQIARSVLAIDSAVGGYPVRTFALPLGVWPRNRELAARGSWRDSRSGREVRYAFDAVLNVAGPLKRTPERVGGQPTVLNRVQVFGDALECLLRELDRIGR